MNNTCEWYGRPYYSLDAYFKNTYGHKCYKIAVDAGFTCPNRDGRLDDRGCIFCSAGGSGDFAIPATDISIDEQIRQGVASFNKSYGDSFVIYFQAYTNTYGDVTRLRRLYTEALENDSVIGISIATRPDCLGEAVIALLDELNRVYSRKGKFIWVELGLQTIHKKTVDFIRRHYELEIYNHAIDALHSIHIPYITHIILGLPGEDEGMMLQTVRYVCGCESKPFGIKLQLLHVLKGTDLADVYEKGGFRVMDMEEYIALVIKCVQNIDRDIVLHRVTGDGPKSLLIEPKWSANKKLVMNTLHKRFKEAGAYQGQYI